MYWRDDLHNLNKNCFLFKLSETDVGNPSLEATVKPPTSYVENSKNVEYMVLRFKTESKNVYPIASLLLPIFFC